MWGRTGRARVCRERGGQSVRALGIRQQGERQEVGERERLGWAGATMHLGPVVLGLFNFFSVFLFTERFANNLSCQLLFVKCGTWPQKFNAIYCTATKSLEAR